MPFRPMTEKEIKDTDKLIAKFKKQLELTESSIATLEAQKKEGVWYSEINWSKK